MPTDIISACRTQHFGPTLSRKTIDAEQKSGFLILLSQTGTRKDVRVVVYRTSLEHFAVIYPRKRLSKPFSVVNLRNTAVESDGSGFFVKQKGFDNTVIARFVCQARDVEGWIAAFSSPAQMKSCQYQTLPVLIEAEES